MTEFQISAKWLSESGRTEIDTTLCKLLIKLGERNVTEYVDGDRVVHPCLEIPAYPLAEWIAENWWPLLWEPRKNEDDGDSAFFLSRHSFLSAQHGFALPRVVIAALGTAVQVSASARDVPFADVRFKNGASVSAKREVVENTLRAFVTQVLERLERLEIKDTCLHDAWTLISETTPDEAQFCRFAGALGQSPYDIDDVTSALLERLQPNLGERLLMDLCSVSSVRTFPEIAVLAERAIELTANASASTLAPLDPIAAPQDNTSLPAHRRGRRGAEFVRQRLGIKDTDPRGATKVFEALEIDTARRNGQNDDDSSVTGAVVRDDKNMKVALLQPTEHKRRFSAARALFSAWSAEHPTESHLLTAAVTRDQQANRAFAAELTAPRALIRARASKQSLTMSAVFDLAAELQIGADVIQKQALNNGIRVRPA